MMTNGALEHTPRHGYIYTILLPSQSRWISFTPVQGKAGPNISIVPFVVMLFHFCLHCVFGSLCEDHN